MAENKRSAGFLQIFVLVLLIVATGITMWIVMSNRQHSREVRTERARYAELDSQARHYIETINAKYPGKITHNTSCNYTSVKLGKGALSCKVESVLSYETSSSPDDILQYVKAKAMSLPWGEQDDATEENSKYSPDLKYLMNYGTPGKLSCSISSYQDANSYTIYALCSGPALAEYYPVVGD